jgi:hypothetical protein
VWFHTLTIIDLSCCCSILWSKEKQPKSKKKYFWTYQPLGNRRYITTTTTTSTSGNNGDGTGTTTITTTTIIDNVTKKIDTTRIQDIETKTLLKFSEFRSAHCSSCRSNNDNDNDNHSSSSSSSSSCSGGYFNAIAPEICI